ncbi:MAG: Ig-like domain-containing protein, partial [Spirochaetaceae bacterium]|nr:Ig-like domain-containing protein [Spirochaetaceae bacterium]
PTADIEDTSNIITLKNAGLTDLAGNLGIGTTSSSNYMIDTKVPVTPGVTLVSDTGSNPSDQITRVGGLGRIQGVAPPL